MRFAMNAIADRTRPVTAMTAGAYSNGTVMPPNVEFRNIRRRAARAEEADPTISPFALDSDQVGTGKLLLDQPKRQAYLSR